MYHVQVISMIFMSDLVMSLLHVASPWSCVYFAGQDEKCCMWHNQQINHVDIIDDHLQHFSVDSWYDIRQKRLVVILITSVTSVWMYDSLLCCSNSLHKLWMMHWSWSYFQMLMGFSSCLTLVISKSVQVWKGPIGLPLSPWKSSSSVASWGLVLVTLFFPCIYYLVASCIPWVSDWSIIEGCDLMVHLTSLLSVCWTSTGCGLSLIWYARAFIYTWSVCLPSLQIFIITSCYFLYVFPFWTARVGIASDSSWLSLVACNIDIESVLSAFFPLYIPDCCSKLLHPSTHIILLFKTFVWWFTNLIGS